jgi:hypothetical protein
VLKCVVTTTALAHHCLHHDFREPLMLAGLRRLELWGGVNGGFVGESRFRVNVSCACFVFLFFSLLTFDLG